MAYNVSNDWIAKCYSGESLYSCRLLIDDILVPIEQISKIDINSPIIDNSSQDKPFYIGTFISQSITINFKSLEGLNIKSGSRVDLYIGQIVDEEETYEEIPIGKFLIDEIKENYQETCEITCLDYAILFSTNCDYSSALVDGIIKIDDLLEWICDKYGVELGDYPSTNGNVEIGSYDNTQSAKYYISCIAEIKGCNAKMDREGRLILIPIKSSSTRSINALESKSWELGEKYTIKKVTYFDAIRNYSFGAKSYGINYNNNPLYYQGVRLGFTASSDRGNELIIRQDNPFIVDESVVENIYNVVKDLEIWSLKCENYGDLSLDSWDIVTYTLGNESYNTYYSNTTTYEMTVMSKNEVQIPNKQQQVTTNVVGGTQDQRIKKASTRIDNVEGRIDMLVKDTIPGLATKSELSTTAQQIQSLVTTTQTTLEGEITQSASETLTQAGVQIQALRNEIDVNGVSKVSNTLVTIDASGIRTEKEGETFSTQITNKSFEVYDGDTELAFMGYDTSLNKTIARIKELETEKITMGVHRAEPIPNEDRTGWFYVGGA